MLTCQILSIISNGVLLIMLGTPTSRDAVICFAVFALITNVVSALQRICDEAP